MSRFLCLECVHAKMRRAGESQMEVWCSNTDLIEEGYAARVPFRVEQCEGYAARLLSDQSAIAHLKRAAWVLSTSRERPGEVTFITPIEARRREQE